MTLTWQPKKKSPWGRPLQSRLPPKAALNLELKALPKMEPTSSPGNWDVTHNVFKAQNISGEFQRVQKSRIRYQRKLKSAFENTHVEDPDILSLQCYRYLTFFSLGTEWTQFARKRTTAEENTSLILQNMHCTSAICDMHRKCTWLAIKRWLCRWLHQKCEVVNHLLVFSSFYPTCIPCLEQPSASPWSGGYQSFTRLLPRELSESYRRGLGQKG